MTEEALLFQSDIVANIDTKAAERQLGKLAEAASAANTAITGAFTNLRNLVARIDTVASETFDTLEETTRRLHILDQDIKHHAEVLADIREEQDELVDSASNELETYTRLAREYERRIDGLRQEKREQGEAIHSLQLKLKALEEENAAAAEGGQIRVAAEQAVQDEIKTTISAVEDLESRIRSIMTKYSGRAKDVKPGAASFGEFTGKTVVEGALAQMIELYQEQYKTIGLKEILSTLNKVIEENAAIVATGANRSTEAVKESWLQLKHDLFGDPIIIDIVDAMEHHLVKRMADIINKHNKVVGGKLVVPYQEAGKSMEDLAKKYGVIIDEMEKDHKKIVDGVWNMSRTVEQILDDLDLDKRLAGSDPKKLSFVDRIQASLHQLKMDASIAWTEMMDGLQRSVQEAPKALELWWREQVAVVRDTFKSTAVYTDIINPLIWQLTKLSVVVPQTLRREMANLKSEIGLVGKELKKGFIDPVKSALDTFALEIMDVWDQITKGDVLGELKKVPGDLGRALVDLVAKAFDDLPLVVHRKATMAGRAAINAGRAVGNAVSNALSSTMSRMKDVLGELGTHMADLGTRAGSRLAKNTRDALEALQQHMTDLGGRAGTALMDAMGSAVNVGMPKLTKITVDIAKKAGDAMVDQFKFTTGGLFDLLTGKDKETRVARRLARAEDLGMTKAFERARKEANYYGVAIEAAADTTEHQMRVIRHSFRDTARNVGMAFGTMVAGQIPFRQSIKGLGIAFDQMADVGSRNVGLTQQVSAVQSHLARTLKVTTASLSGYRRENELLDKNLQRVATAVDNTANRMKDQGQVLIKMHEQRRRQFVEQQTALAKWVAAYDKVVESEEAGSKATVEARKAAGEALVKATKGLEELGIANQVFEGNAQAIQDLSKRLEEFAKDTKNVGKVLDAGLAEKFEKVAKNSKVMFEGLDNELKKMSLNFPKMFSMWNRAIQDVETESKHFLTTLRDGGKISTDRLQNLLLAYQDLLKTGQELQKSGAFRDPQLRAYWENMQRNSLVAIRNFTLMAQRARTVEAVKEKLFGTTKKVTNSIISLGAAARKHIPIIGEKAKVSAEQMDVFRAATDRARTSSSGISFALQGLDPVIGEVTDGIGNMGTQFGEVMNGMAEIAKVKTGSMIKAFTALKLVAIGIVGIFGALMIGTAKLSAEVTTLGITMKTVATNLSVPISYVERLVEVLKKTGITTKEATIAVTQWMRANLAFEWEDPIQKMTYGMEDLARAAQQMAVAMGENSSEMFARFIDFVQTGNSQLLDAAGIMKNSKQMLEEYAKAIGVSVKALSIRQKQEALISGLMRESIKLQGVYTEAMKSASKQLGSMKRYIEELRLEWGKHFEPILAMIVFRFNQLLKYLTDIPDSTKKTITTFITIATAVSGLVLGLGFLIPKLKMVLGLFQIFTKLLLGKFGILLALVSAVAAIFARWFMSIEVESDGVQGLVDRLDKILESFGGLKKILEPVQRWLSSFFSMISHHVNRIKFLIEEIIGGFSEWVANFREQNPELINLIEKTRKVFGDLFAMIWRVLDLILGAVEALLEGDWDRFFEKVKLAGRYILAWFLEFFFEVVVTAYEWGKNIISAFAKGLADKAKVIIPQIMTAIGNLLGAFLEGHSPAKLGPLSNINIWGEGIMDAFLQSMAGKRFRFDEDMFEGIGSLQSKAKLWGDNIIDVFTYGITGRAAQAIGPAMSNVGQLIARFLEGHSPPEVGPLSEIMDWGRNAFEQFLAGFEMADFSFLDRALDLIRRKLQLVVEDSEEAGKKLAESMLAAREFVAGAISRARGTGGPLDLSGLKDIMLGSLHLFAKDVGAVMEALFVSMKAEAEYTNLQDRIEKVREVRADAIKALDDRYQALQDEIGSARKSRESAIKALEDQHQAIQDEIDAQVKARAEAAGLVIDERLMKELQRQLSDASREVQRAQRRLRKVQAEAGKYGVNILTWEEINARAQMDLAERRKDEIEDQLGVQEKIQSEVEAIRYEITQQYADELDAITAQVEELKKLNDARRDLEDARLSAAQEQVNKLKKIDEARSKIEDEELAIAQGKYETAKKNADYLATLLEQRLSYEEELAKANEVIVDKSKGLVEKAENVVEGLAEGFENMYEGLEDIAAAIDLWSKRGVPEPPPTFSELWEEYFGDFGDLLGLGDIAHIGLGGFIKTKIEEIWDKFVATPVGEWFEKAGSIAAIETWISEIGDFLERFGGLGDLFKDAIAGVALGLGIKLPSLEEVLSWFNWFGEQAAGLLGNLFSMLIPDLLTGLMGGGWDNFMTDLEEFTDIVLGWFPSFELTGEQIWEEVGSWGDTLAGYWDTLKESWFEIGPGAWWKWVEDTFKKIGEGVSGAFDTLKKEWFESGPGAWWKWAEEAGDTMAAWFGKLPEKLHKAVDDIIAAIVKPFVDAWNFLVGNSLIPDLIDDIIGFFTDLPRKLLNTMRRIYNAAVEIGKKIYNGVKDKVVEIIDDIVGWFDDVIDNITGAATKFFNAAVAISTEIYNGIKEKIDAVIEDIAGWLESIVSGISGAATSFWNAAVTVASQVYDGFKEKVGDIIDDVVGWFDDIKDEISSTVTAFLAAAKLVGSQVYNGIKSKVDEIATNIGDWFTTIKDNIVAKATAFWNAATTLGVEVFNAIKDKVIGDEGIAAKIGGWLDSVVTGIKNKAEAFLSGAKDVAQQILVGIRDKIIDPETGIVAKIGGWLGSVITKIGEKATAFYDKAKALAWQIFLGLKYYITDSENGIVAKIGGWLGSIITSIGTTLYSFYLKGRAISYEIYKGIKYWITDPTYGIVAKITGWFSGVISKIADVAKGIWNTGLRPGLQGVLDKIANAVNGIINILNTAASAIGLGNTWPFPISNVGAPTLPYLDTGGVIVGDTLAQLHAGEVVLPLDRLESIMRSMNIISNQPPIFAPVMNFYPGASPQQIVPAVDYALNLYEERLRSGT